MLPWKDKTRMHYKIIAIVRDWPVGVDLEDEPLLWMVHLLPLPPMG